MTSNFAIPKEFETKEFKNNSLYKAYKDQLAVPENWEYVKVPILNDNIFTKKNIHYYYKRNGKKYADNVFTVANLRKPVLL